MADTYVEPIPALMDLLVAEDLQVAPSTVHRWLKGETEPKAYISESLYVIIKKHQAAKKSRKTSFTFIDLFAGIGGIRKGFEQSGGTCVFTSEWDSYAQKTYSTNYPSQEIIHGDITQVNAADIPDHDVLLAKHRGLCFLMWHGS